MCSATVFVVSVVTKGIVHFTLQRERERVLRAEKRGREVGFCREYVFFDFFSY